MEKNDLISRLRAAATVFLDRHHPLLRIDVSERAMAHKLAECIAPLFPNWDVDCEYNRHLNQEKRLEGVKDYVRAQRRNNQLADIEEDYGICVPPDIIIHQRMTDESNLLVIEIKKAGHPLPAVEYDFLKLEGYMHEIGYNYGLYLEFGVRDEVGVKNALLFGPDIEDISSKIY